MFVSCLTSAAWPAPAHSVAICEGLEDWGATDLSNLSDSDEEEEEDVEEEEEDQPAPLVRNDHLSQQRRICSHVKEKCTITTVKMHVFTVNSTELLGVMS